MKKRRVIVVILAVMAILLLSSCAITARRENLRQAVPRVVRQSLNSIVMIKLTSEIKTDDGKTEISEEFSGTGFFIGYGGDIYIVSAGHLADEDPSGVFSAETVDGKRFPLKIIYYKDRYSGDFALFSFDKGMNITITPLDLGETPKTGDWVISIGAPFGVFPFVTVGVVSSGAYDLDEEGGFVYILYSAEINPGNSGGPLLDLEGKLVGMNLKTVHGVAISFAAPAARIKKYMREAMKSLSIQK